METLQDTYEPVMLRSDYERYIFALNTKQTNDLPSWRDIPLRGRQGLVSRYATASFVEDQNGYWWLESKIELMENPTDAYFKWHLDNTVEKNGRKLIGLATFEHRNVPFIVEIFDDVEANEYRIEARSRCDNNGRFKVLERRIQKQSMDGTILEKYDLLTYHGKEVERELTTYSANFIPNDFDGDFSNVVYTG